MSVCLVPVKRTSIPNELTAEFRSVFNRKPISADTFYVVFQVLPHVKTALCIMLCSAFILKFIIAVAALAVAGIIIITRTFEVKHFKNLREANRHNFCSHQNVNKIFA